MDCCGGDMMGGGWGWMALWGGFWFLLVAGGIGLIAWAIARGRGSGSSGGIESAGGDRSLATLRDRFARGEIDEAEYRERRRVLESREAG